MWPIVVIYYYLSSTTLLMIVIVVEKRSVLQNLTASLINLRNFRYNILKRFENKTARNIDFLELSHALNVAMIF